MRFLVLHVLSVFVVPMVSVRFPWFPWFLCGFYGRYIFSPVSMGSIFFSGFHGFYGFYTCFLWVWRFPWFPLALCSLLVPMCFSLGTHCGGRRCALPPAPPHPLLCLNRFPLLPTIPFFLHKHHRLFGLISSLLISIETCASVLLSWSSRSYLQYIHWDLCLCASLLVRIAGGGAAPSPCTPPPAFIFKPVPLATYYSFLFA